MSTNFIPDASIPMAALRAFNRHGVKAETDDGHLTLTDGRNWLHVNPENKSDPMMFERRGSNDPSAIVQAVESAFGVRLVSEYEPEYERLLVGKRKTKP